MRVGIIGDLHLPFTHPRYIDFCTDIFEAWSVDQIVYIGDVVDHHALGFWETDPDGLSAGRELDEAVKGVRQWHAAFGPAPVTIGNHDERHVRSARRAGIPVKYLRDYRDVFGTPDWKWVPSIHFDKVLYEHGTGGSGKFAAYNRCIESRTSLVIGHYHTGGGVMYHTSNRDRIFGLNVGCGIDCDRYAFAYGNKNAKRPTLGCGVVIDGSFAAFEPMLISRGERYRRQKRRRRC